jgi:aldose sugar dehydrogenase
MTPPSRLDRILAALLALSLVGLVVLGVMVFGLRSDLDEIEERAGKLRKQDSTDPNAPSTTTESDALEQGLEDLRVCFNKALENSFEDFYRYVFGGEEPPTVDKIVETCGVLSTKLKAELYKGGLSFPVDMATVPDSETMFFTEKASGNIRVMHGKDLVKEPCATVRTSAEGERGTLGIVLDPEFESNGYLYVYYTNAEPLENRVTRFTVDGDSCTQAEDIITGIPATTSTRHVGGQLEIVDDKLYVSVGDGYDDPSTAQDTSSPLGKVNRYNLDGSIPSDNPFSGDGGASPAWTIGHRNPFGLAHNPETGQIYVTENGPDCDDELNLVEEGTNYGWGPGYECGTAGVGEDPVEPLVAWTPPIVVTDPWFYTGTTQDLTGYLYVGDFGSGQLRRFTMNEDGTKVLREDVVYDSPSQIVDVTEGPHGLLYFATATGIYRMVEKG